MSPAGISTEDYQQPIIIAGCISTKCHVCIWRSAKQHRESEASVSSTSELVLKRTKEWGGNIRRRACCDWEKNRIDPSGESHSHSCNWNSLSLLLDTDSHNPNRLFQNPTRLSWRRETTPISKCTVRNVQRQHKAAPHNGCWRHLVIFYSLKNIDLSQETP